MAVRPAEKPTLDHLGDFTTTARVIPIAGLAVGIGVVAAYVAAALLKLIGFFTNLFFFQIIALTDLLAARAKILDAEHRRERVFEMSDFMPPRRRRQRRPRRRERPPSSPT